MNMGKNVKIAKELVKLAKNLVADGQKDNECAKFNELSRGAQIKYMSDAMSDDSFPKEKLLALFKGKCMDVGHFLKHPQVDKEMIDEVVETLGPDAAGESLGAICMSLYNDKNKISTKSLCILAKSSDYRVRAVVAEDPNTDIETLKSFCNYEECEYVKCSVAMNPKINQEIIDLLIAENKQHIDMELVDNPSVSKKDKELLKQRMFNRIYP